MGKLLCVGDLNLDVSITLDYPLAIGSDTAGAVALYGGGSAANVAAWAARAGADVDFRGVLGDDHSADFLISELSGHGVAVHPIQRTNSTGRTIAAIVGPSGERSLISDHGTDIAATESDFDDSWFDDVAWLHLTGYTYITGHSRDFFGFLTSQAKARGVPYSIDPSAAHLLQTNCDVREVREAFAGAQVLLPNQDEAEYLTGGSDPAAAAVELLELAATVVVTCGPHGAHSASRSEPPLYVPASAAGVVNTLGAGDAFAGGFLASKLAGSDLTTATTAGIAAATKAIKLPSAR
jgi:sugar/nucleoside kinase (ribokinase family)